MDFLSVGVEVDTLYIDYSKAVDKVDHLILLKKLQIYGVTGNYYKWIKCFLSGRKQVVSVNNNFSYETPAISGVPQGSVLGPLLFILYINDMVHSIKYSKLQTFADDTKIAHPILSVSDKVSLQNDLEIIKQWSKENNMELNQKKFELIRHQAKVKTSTAVLKDLKELPFMNDVYTYAVTNSITIYPTSTVRDLGILIDSQLNWDSHVTKITMDARKMSG